jgi:hypothetical protein
MAEAVFFLVYFGTLPAIGLLELWAEWLRLR